MRTNLPTDIDQINDELRRLRTRIDQTARLISVGGVTVEGIDVTDHAARHDFGGADALSTVPTHDHSGDAGDGGQLSHADLSNIDANQHVDHTAVTLTAGAGLTGGGDISANRTFAVGAGDGIDVAANSVAVDVTDLLGSGLTESSNNIDLDWGTPTIGTIEPDDSASAGTSTNPARSDHQHAIAAAVASTLSVSTSNTEGSAPSFARSDHTHAITTSHNPGAAASILASAGDGSLTLTDLTLSGALSTSRVNSHLIPQTVDTYDLGSASLLWRKGWISELEAILFVENSIQVTGGWWMVPHASGTLAADVDSADTTIDFGQAMTPGDFVLLRGNNQVEYLEVGALSSGTTYNVTRDLDGSGANDWPEGQVYAVKGQSGDGNIQFNAQTGGPRISIFTQGATYNAEMEMFRAGDLDGWGPYASTIYGVAIGDYSGGDYLSYDPTNGLTIAGDGSGVTNIDGGNIQTGTVTATQITGTSLSAIYADLGTVTSGRIELFSSGSIASTNATGLVLDDSLSYDSDNWNLLSLDSGTWQVGIGTDGKFYGAEGNVIVDDAGVRVYEPGLGMRFEDSGTAFGAITGYEDSGTYSAIIGAGISSELLDNPTFDSNVNNWSGSSGDIVGGHNTTDERSGAGCAEVFAFSDPLFLEIFYYSDEIDVLPGDTLTGEIYAKNDSSGNDISWTAVIQFLDSGSSVIKTVTGDVLGSSVTSYTKLTVNSVAPPGAVTCRFGVRSFTSATQTNTIYVDDASLTGAMKVRLSVRDDYITANAGITTSGGIYVGSTGTGPTAGTITATDYIVALGGLHVGGTSDPGTDNLMVDGKVGIGTTSPTAKLDVSETEGFFRAIGIDSTNDFIATSLRAYAGYGAFYTITENAVADKWYIGSKPSDNTLYIGTGFPSSSYNDKVMIDSSGNVGIGTTLPSYELDVDGDIGYSGSITDYSLRQYKEDIRPVDERDDVLAALKALPVYEFRKRPSKDGERDERWRANSLRYGLVADDPEVERYAPHLLSWVESEDGGIEKRGLDLGAEIGFLVAVVQAQQEQIDELQRARR